MTTPEYRQPTHREELERELVHGAATHIASEPHHAGAIAEAIKTVLDTLYPIAATPTSGPDNSHAAAVLYPAIERAMGELSKLHEGFNMEVNRAFNILRDALWSECPAPASAVPKRRETADAEHRPKPHSLERAMKSKTYQDGTTAFGPAPLPDVSPALWAKPLAKEVPELTESLSDLGLEREIQANSHHSGCKGERCMASAANGYAHSRECIDEAGEAQGWTPTAEDYAKCGPSAGCCGAAPARAAAAKTAQALADEWLRGRVKP